MNVLIKFSGEFFTAFDQLSEDGLNFLNILKKHNINSGYIVVGGGNRIRGVNTSYERTEADKIGVISTLMNGYILQENLKKFGKNNVLFSHFEGFGEIYDPNKCIQNFKLGNFIILTTGLGRVGYISTDLSSVIKALELKVDYLIKVTKVNGVFDKDPLKNNDAVKYDKITYKEVLEKQLKVMDLAAFAIASENNLKTIICDINGFESFLNGKITGTLLEN